MDVKKVVYQGNELTNVSQNSAKDFPESNALALERMKKENEKQGQDTITCRNLNIPLLSREFHNIKIEILIKNKQLLRRMNHEIFDVAFATKLHKYISENKLNINKLDLSHLPKHLMEEFHKLNNAKK